MHWFYECWIIISNLKKFYLNQSIQETLECFAELIVKILYLQVCLVKDKASWAENLQVIHDFAAILVNKSTILMLVSATEERKKLFLLAAQID